MKFEVEQRIIHEGIGTGTVLGEGLHGKQGATVRVRFDEFSNELDVAEDYLQKEPKGTVPTQAAPVRAPTTWAGKYGGEWGLNRKAEKALKDLGYTSAEQAAALTDEQLRAIKGVGQGTVDALRRMFPDIRPGESVTPLSPDELEAPQESEGTPQENGGAPELSHEPAISDSSEEPIAEISLTRAPTLARLVDQLTDLLDQGRVVAVEGPEMLLHPQPPPEELELDSGPRFVWRDAILPEREDWLLENQDELVKSFGRGLTNRQVGELWNIPPGSITVVKKMLGIPIKQYHLGAAPRRRLKPKESLTDQVAAALTEFERVCAESNPDELADHYFGTVLSGIPDLLDSWASDVLGGHVLVTVARFLRALTRMYNENADKIPVAAQVPVADSQAPDGWTWQNVPDQNRPIIQAIERLTRLLVLPGEPGD